VALTILLIAGILAVLTVLFRDELAPATPVEVTRVILLDQAGTQSAPVTASPELLFQSSGWLEPDPWPVKVSTLVDGFVETVFVKEGEAVTNGQILARLDPADVRLLLAEAEADVATAAAGVRDADDRWERIKALGARDAATVERVEAQNAVMQAEGRLRAGQARRDAASLAVERTVIRAPMDGIVLRRYVDPGSKRGRALDNENSADRHAL